MWHAIFVYTTCGVVTLSSMVTIVALHRIEQKIAAAMKEVEKSQS